MSQLPPAPLSLSGLADPTGLVSRTLPALGAVRQLEQQGQGRVAGEVVRLATNPIDLGILALAPQLLPSRLARFGTGAALGTAGALAEGRSPREAAVTGGVVGGLSALPGIRRIRPPSATTTAPVSRAPLSSAASPRLRVEGTEEITTAAQRLINRNPTDPIATEETPRLFRRISQAMRQGRIAADDIPALRDAGLGTEEAAHLFEQASTFSGQTLNRLSQVARQIERVAPELASELQRQAKLPPTVWNRIANAPRQVVNLWRASLVSQLATAVRNFAVFNQRHAFRIIENAVNGTYETVTRTKAPAQAFGPMLEDLAAIGRSLRPGNRQRVLQLLSDIDPLLKEKLWQTPVSDVAITGKYAKLLSTFNNAQEYFARTLAADAVMAGEARRAGAQITLPMARKAVERALDMTFAAYPRSRFGQNFIRLWNNPVMNVLTYPFPRYLTNAVRTIWEHSPAGVMRLLHPRYQAILRSGDPRAAVEVATKAGLGSAMFATASWIRNSAWAGERWYEVRMPDGKTVDVRPFGPLLPVYLFLAQAIKDPSGFELRDWTEGLLGINRMAGTTLFLTSVLAGKNPDTLKRKLAEFSGQFLGGFTVPLRTFQDAVAQFSQEEATLRDVRQQPFTGPAQSNIPGASRQLPPRFFVTRPGTVQRESSGVRQLTGLTVRTKNLLERELDRLDLGSFQLEPRTGNRQVDQAITRRMGQLAERGVVPLITDPIYQSSDRQTQQELLRQRFSDLRQQVTIELQRENPAIRAFFNQKRLERQTQVRRRVQSRRLGR